MTRLGEWHRDPALLEQAARLYQAALPAASDNQVQTGATFGLQAQLALAVAAFAQLNDLAELHQTAVATLLDDLPELETEHPPHNSSGLTRLILIARIRQAIAAWHLANEDPSSAAEHTARATEARAAAGIPAPANSHTDSLPPPQGQLTDSNANAA